MNFKIKIITLISFCLPAICAFSQDSTSLTDGPYLFYDNSGNATIENITDNNVSNRSLAGNTINVTLPGHPDWNFSLALRKTLNTEPCEWDAPNKLFVISDIEGEFEGFRAVLLANHIIDKKYNWTFGKGQLVIDGDLFDRGREVVQELWLLYKLEDEAKANGGYVHTILGDHGIMNLSGDLRYVDKKYFEAARLMGKDYMQFYDNNTELGRWLRTKNVMEKIGSRIFIHGGVSPIVNAMGLSIETINSECRKYYGTGYRSIPNGDRDLFNQNALFWYRGYFMSPRATMQTVDSTLQLYHCSQVVVGHTIIKDRNPALYYNGKILGVDVNMHKGQRAAVLIERDKYYKVDDTGSKVLMKYSPGNDMIDIGDID